jgi:lipoate-protein ligase A
MSMEWRLLDLMVADCYTQMAIDEAIAYARGRQEAPPTIRLYRWEPSAVSIGYFQSLEDEVNLEACKRLGVDAIRRISGGGAVFHDYNGEITYSLIAEEENRLIPVDISESYRVICGGIIEAMRLLRLEAEFKPINDIQAGGRKISGNAQTRRYGSVLQHGTVLVDLPSRTMFTVLNVSKEKISDKAIKQAEDRVTTIRRELGRFVSFSEVRDALVSGFEKALGICLVPGRLSKAETELVAKFRERYASQEWLRRR